MSITNIEENLKISNSFIENDDRNILPIDDNKEEDLSFISKNSFKSINKCLDLLKENDNDNNKDAIKEQSNTKIKRTLISEPQIKSRIPNSIKTKIKEIIYNSQQTSKYFKSIPLKNSKPRLQQLFKDKIFNDYYIYQNKIEGKAINNIKKRNFHKDNPMPYQLMSTKVMEKNDMEDFKSQLDYFSPEKKNPFGLKDFEKRFMQNLNKDRLIKARNIFHSNIIYGHNSLSYSAKNTL